jgi:glycosyltransferase involved in cell wall biosynthesis/Flp pilus assembly protein TadD
MSVIERAKQWYKSSAVAIGRLNVKYSSTNPDAHHRLGKALVQAGQWEAAIAACHQAIELDSKNPWFYKTLAEAHMGQGQWKAAILASQTGIALNPNLPWLHHGLSKALMSQEKWAAAIVAVRRAIDLKATVSWFHFTLGEACFQSGQWEAAIDPLRRAIELAPRFPWSYYYLGQVLVAQEKIEAAIAVYQQVLKRHPNLEYLQSCLDYALHLKDQDQRIQAYCQMYSQTCSQTQVNERDRPLQILMITPYPTYPPKHGAITRMFYEMQALGRQHHLVVVSFVFSQGDYRLEAEVSRYCDLSITVMLGDAPPRQPHQPKLIHRYSSQRMRKILNVLKTANFDVLLCDFIYMAQYRDIFENIYCVLGEHNIESQLLKRCAEINSNVEINRLATQTESVKAFFESDSEAGLLAAFETEYWQKFNLRMVVSEYDRQTLEDRCKIGQTIVVNNGIDINEVTLLNNPHSKTILFIGTLNYYPNIDGACYFVEQILPIVWQQDPTISFWMAGADPPQMILDLAQDSRIRVIANPESMSDVAQDCQMTIVPLRVGGGTRIKILHSMAMGLPVVTTRLGCEGLAIVEGVHLLVRDHPKAFAEAILQLLSDGELQEKLRVKGRKLVEQQYDWQEIFQQAEQQIVAGFQQWQRARSSLPFGDERSTEKQPKAVPNPHPKAGE